MLLIVERGVGDLATLAKADAIQEQMSNRHSDGATGRTGETKAKALDGDKKNQGVLPGMSLVRDLGEKGRDQGRNMLSIG